MTSSSVPFGTLSNSSPVAGSTAANSKPEDELTHCPSMHIFMGVLFST
ncbi:MAG: hypothetical protein JRN33_07290 [Nitrososphaerota archaeon]|nr:hypothetical protein [Nitrososphaerota archaeon]